MSDTEPEEVKPIPLVELVPGLQNAVKAATRVKLLADRLAKLDPCKIAVEKDERHIRRANLRLFYEKSPGSTEEVEFDVILPGMSKEQALYIIDETIGLAIRESQDLEVDSVMQFYMGNETLEEAKARRAHEAAEAKARMAQRAVDAQTRRFKFVE